MSKEALVEKRTVRQKYLDIHPDFILSLLRIAPEGEMTEKGFVTIEKDPIPQTAKVARMAITPQGTLALFLEDDSFPETEELKQIPRLEPLYTLHDKTRERSVLQVWTTTLTMMQQSVLITTCRGPDGLDKYHVAKKLCCWFRRCFLLSAFDKKVLTRPYDTYNRKGGSFTGASIALPIGISFTETSTADKDEWAFEEMQRIARVYFKTTDEVPHHFQMHLIHAAEILGYKHPDSWTRSYWKWFYTAAVHKLHLHPETEEEMDLRLSDNETAWHAAEEVTADHPK